MRDGSGRCTGVGANHPSPTYQEEFGPPLEGREEAAGALADEDERSGSKVRTQGVRELDCAERMARRFLEDRDRALDHALDLLLVARR